MERNVNWAWIKVWSSPWLHSSNKEENTKIHLWVGIYTFKQQRQVEKSNTGAWIFAIWIFTTICLDWSSDVFPLKWFWSQTLVQCNLLGNLTRSSISNKHKFVGRFIHRIWDQLAKMKADLVQPINTSHSLILHNQCIITCLIVSHVFTAEHLNRPFMDSLPLCAACLLLPGASTLWEVGLQHTH